MNKLLSKAIKLASAIEDQYDLLTIEHEWFFNQFHDDLLCQKDCAWRCVDDVEHYIEKSESLDKSKSWLDYAEQELDNLNTTLTYCKAVIKLQNSINLPESIFG